MADVFLLELEDFQGLYDSADIRWGYRECLLDAFISDWSGYLRSSPGWSRRRTGQIIHFWACRPVVPHHRMLLV